MPTDEMKMLTLNNTLTRKTISLLALAIASALLWYIEVIHHGWSGLTWISYFHWAIPIGVGSFVLWASWAGPFQSTKQRIKFIVLASILAPILFVITQTVLILLLGGGPSAFVVWMSLMCWLPESVSAAFVIYPWLFKATLISWGVLMPIMMAQTLRLVGLSIRWHAQLIATLLFCSAYPVGLFVSKVFGASKYVDALHIIKSGTAIPMLIIGLGALFLLPQYANPNKDNP